MSTSDRFCDTCGNSEPCPRVVEFSVRLVLACNAWHGRNVSARAAVGSAPCSDRDADGSGYRGSKFVTLIDLLNTMLPSSNARVDSVKSCCIIEIFYVVLKDLDRSIVVDDRSRCSWENASYPGKATAFVEDGVLLLLFSILFPYGC